MSRVRLILALHDHQPVGNFDSVFEAAYQDSYLPFLELMEQYPALPFSLHTSGPLVEWLDAHRPEYIARLRAMVAAGRVEILGGGFYEPILTMIPHRDRVGQLRSYADYLREVLGQPIRGAWIAERVWEQHLASALVEAGMEFTVLDDFHFQRAGAAADDLFGYYLTEDEGNLLKVFPNSERMRYLVPWQEPHDAYEYLRSLADSRPGAVVVCADDGEKFGGWPETHEHIFTKGWLRRFCDMLMGNLDWLEPTTFGAVVDSTVPLGKVYLPDCSYREMTEWVLPPAQLAAFESAVKGSEGVEAAGHLRSFARAGGFWRNFKSKYAETDEMYARMLDLSRRVDRADADGRSEAGPLDEARRELYRAQCNCPYWHGAFGGLYLPHLRNAIYGHLIACNGALDRAEGRTGPRVSIDAADYNLDARMEAKLENDRLIALVRPASGGHVYELDVRHAGVNVLATLDRRPEPYHGAIATAALAGPSLAPAEGPSNLHDRVILKQEGMDRLLVYDRTPRKALVDHFLPLDAAIDDLARCLDVERGDFAGGAYLSKTHREDGRVALMMERSGIADGHLIRISKTIAMEAGRPGLEVIYILEDLPTGVPLHFAVELNLAAMAGHAEDRFYSAPHGERLGMLDARIDLPEAEGVDLSDEWLDLGVALRWSTPGGLWCFPVETASQSEGGFEGIYQSSAVVPHWRVVADHSGRWSVRISWTLDRIHSRPEDGDGADPEPDRAASPRAAGPPTVRVADSTGVR